MHSSREAEPPDLQTVPAQDLDPRRPAVHALLHLLDHRATTSHFLSTSHVNDALRGFEEGKGRFGGSEHTKELSEAKCAFW